MVMPKIAKPIGTAAVPIVPRMTTAFFQPSASSINDPVITDIPVNIAE